VELILRRRHIGEAENATMEIGCKCLVSLRVAETMGSEEMGMSQQRPKGRFMRPAYSLLDFRVD
jgi:hypothetical protein